MIRNEQEVSLDAVRSLMTQAGGHRVVCSVPKIGVSAPPQCVVDRVAPAEAARARPPDDGAVSVSGRLAGGVDHDVTIENPVGQRGLVQLVAGLVVFGGVDRL